MIKEAYFMSDPSVCILIADDDDDDILLTQKALKKSRLINCLFSVNDGEELMMFLRNTGKYKNKKKFPKPGIILLDLNMPKKDGREALKDIKSDPKLRQIPVIVLTTSKAEEDIFKTYDLGVNSFITKPISLEKLIEVINMVGKYWFEIV